jgi:hypothetical protein
MPIDFSKFGPFANIAALVGILVALFAFLVPRAIGSLSNWTYLAGGTPSFLVGAAGRVISVVVIALSFVLINKTNALYFGGAAIVVAVAAAFFIVRFNRSRLLWTTGVTKVRANGQPLKDKKGKDVIETLVIGTESEMRDDAKKDYERARKAHGGISLARFMAGNGQSINDPGAIWPNEVLVDHQTALTTGLIYIVTFSVLALYLAALVLDAMGEVGTTG